MSPSPDLAKPWLTVPTNNDSSYSPTARTVIRTYVRMNDRTDVPMYVPTPYVLSPDELMSTGCACGLLTLDRTRTEKDRARARARQNK